MNMIFSTFVKFLGMAVLLCVVYYTSILSDDNFVYYSVLHIPSIILVVVGTIGLAFASANYKDVFYTFFDMFRNPPSVMKKKIKYVQKNLEEITDNYYANGPAGAKSSIKIDSMPPKWDSIFAQLESKISPAEIIILLKRHATLYTMKIDNQIKFIKILKSSAPSLGMFGTILGLVKMLDDLSDFSTIGPNMSLALLTTLYGILMSILLDPLISHLEEKRVNFLKSVEQSNFWLDSIIHKKPGFFMNQEFRKTK